jgi:hypothetical protein
MGLRHALMRITSTQPDFTRVTEGAGGDLFRRATSFTRYIDEDRVDDDVYVLEPGGGHQR